MAGPFGAPFATAPPRSPGPLGFNDAGDPNVRAWAGPTPGATGIADAAALQQVASPGEASPPDRSAMSGSEPIAGVGLSAVVRIPVPNTGGLALELSPRGWVPKGGSTSTLFIQDITGKRHLRLDYGFNVKTHTIDYHWNQKGTFQELGIADHAPAGAKGKALYNAAKVGRIAGRALLVVGVALDVVSIVQARKRWRQVAKVLAGWGGAWVGCKVVGAAGAAGGTFIEPGGGTAVGGFVGCGVGGALGYFGSSMAAETLYDRVEETWFEPVPTSTDAWSMP
jgi:hypothetical protein